jgi:DNA-binding Lrp family transcriptional regulator
MALTAETATRVIHFFDLGIKFEDVKDEEKAFKQFFSAIAYLSDGKDKDERRYQSIGGKLLFVQDVRFTTDTKLITGKIRAIRTDDMPELINMDTDATREIDKAEREGIVETTHFVISYRKKEKKIGVEYHLSGAKAHELKSYLLAVRELGSVTEVGMVRIVNGNVLSEVERRMGRVGEIHMKVPKDNIGQLQKVEGQVASMFQTAQDYADTDAVTIDLNFNAKRRQQTNQAEGILRTLTKVLRLNKGASDAFDSLTVKVEDNEHNNRMQIFDLLADKAKTTITVNKKPSGAGLDSVDIFEKIATAMNRLNYL